ncbi:WG repeat-containing protein [Urechidicola vernalis]|uniref:WG repeat-containing protein n=1 Tax=Urechidicola vernalis TaxID=3075600 RepID=A0ABU2Y2U9_9FLAO|nr:WG repeat-containing protein [Urechidicola sp. P050]MDT0552146.1 WG repeat-containing protein [Urechidicola sp. P050]
MKNFKIIVVIFLIPLFCFSQDLTDIDFVSPFHDGYAAVKKGDQWAFINEKGAIVIDFRDDLVPEKHNDVCYPVLKNDLFLIQRNENNLTYFGFADVQGKTVIAPKFLKAKSFEFNNSIALLLIKQNLGYNKLLDKPMVSYKYREVLIDKSGEIVDYLSPLYPFSVDAYAKKSPEIKSKIVSKDIVAVAQDNTFSLRKY